MEPSGEQTFKDRNRALQEMARELHLVRQHNLQFKENDPQDKILMFAEAALVCMVMEHFLRAVVARAGGPADATLRTLLEFAVARNIVRLPWQDEQDGIQRVCDVRNSLLHANYAQAAQQARCASVRDYFRTQFASEIESMFKITDVLMKQIDPATGQPLSVTP